MTLILWQKQQALVPGFDGVGYVVFDHDDDETFNQPWIGVQAAFGTEPSCEHQTIRLADTALACTAFDRAIPHRAYVFVSSSAGCPVHEKAMHVQNAGGQGLVFAGEFGQRPVRVPTHKNAQEQALQMQIQIPIIMIHHHHGRDLREHLMRNTHRRHVVTQARFFFSRSCLKKQGLVESKHVEQWQQHDSPDEPQPYESIIQSGILKLQETDQEFEFLMMKGRRGALSFRMDQALILVMNESMGCPGDDTIVEMKQLFVIARLGACSIADQIVFYQDQGAMAVAFAVEPPDLIHYVQQSHPPRTIISSTLPIMLVSLETLAKVLLAAEDLALHASIEARDEILQAWMDLAHLWNPRHWPRDERDRKRLFHRITKAHDHPPSSERYSGLMKAFYVAQIYHGSNISSSRVNNH